VRTIVDGIRAAARDNGTLTVLNDHGAVAGALPWSAVHVRACRMAGALVAAGVRRGGRVGLLGDAGGDTGLDVVAAIQAVWLAGAAITVLPPATRGGANLRAIVADARPDLLVTTGETLAGTGVPTIPPAALRTGGRSVDMPAALLAGPAPGDLAVLQYSSGSTRTPRGIPVTHANLAANITAIQAATGHAARHPCRMLSWLPLYHDMGLVGFLTAPMACGCPLTLQSPTAFARRPTGWLAALSRYRIAVSGAPNFAYGLLTPLLRAGLAADLNLGTVQLLLSGGEPVDAGTMAGFVAAAARYGLDPGAIVPAYGLAESTLAVTIPAPGAGVRVDRVDPDALERENRAVPAPDGRALVRLGGPVPGTELRIADPDTGAPLPARRVGRIEVRGPSVVGRYWGDPAAEAGRWLDTGDLGYLVDGELVVCGRRKDVLFAAGRNVFPQDVESAAAQVPGVRAGGVAAFGVPGDGGDRLVVAVEVRGPARAGDLEALRRAVASAVRDEVGLTPYAVLPLPAGRLPRTSSGKLRRAETRQRYQHGDLIIHKGQKGERDDRR
jgi:fatty-acyl-CoA synthase